MWLKWMREPLSPAANFFLGSTGGAGLGDRTNTSVSQVASAPGDVVVIVHVSSTVAGTFGITPDVAAGIHNHGWSTPRQVYDSGTGQALRTVVWVTKLDERAPASRCQWLIHHPVTTNRFSMVQSFSGVDADEIKAVSSFALNTAGTLSSMDFVGKPNKMYWSYQTLNMGAVTSAPGVASLTDSFGRGSANWRITASNLWRAAQTYTSNNVGLLATVSFEPLIADKSRTLTIETDVSAVQHGFLLELPVLNWGKAGPVSVAGFAAFGIPL